MGCGEIKIEWRFWLEFHILPENKGGHISRHLIPILCILGKNRKKWGLPHFNLSPFFHFVNGDCINGNSSI